MSSPSDARIEELALSARTYNNLKQNGVDTIRDLLNKVSGQHHFLGLGEKAFSEIFEKVVTYLLQNQV